MPAPITCTCMTCRKCVAREQNRRRTRLKAYGQWEYWADPEPARQHVRNLMAGGTSVARIADAVGVPTRRLSSLVYGRHGRHVTKIRHDFSQAVLAVEPNPRCIPIWRVSRRLRALCALGYSQPVLAERLGVSQPRVWEILHNHGTNTTVDTFNRIDRIYRELCMTLPPRTNRGERISAAKAQAAARNNGWVPPLAWNDIDTDPTPVARALCNIADCDNVQRQRGLCDKHYRRWLAGNLPDYTPPDPAAHQNLVDPVVVAHLLEGRTVDSTCAEKDEAMRRWKAMGKSQYELCRIHGWKDARYGREGVA